MEIRLSNVNGKYNLCMETSKNEHVELGTWGYDAGRHHVEAVFYNVKKEEVIQAFAKEFSDELKELILDALAHFANHCPYCDRDLEFAPTTEELGEWLSKGLATETVKGGINGK